MYATRNSKNSQITYQKLTELRQYATKSITQLTRCTTKLKFTGLGQRTTKPNITRLTQCTTKNHRSRRELSQKSLNSHTPLLKIPFSHIRLQNVFKGLHSAPPTELTDYASKRLFPEITGYAD